MKILNVCFKSALTVLLLLLLSGCIAWLAPKVQADLVKLKAGQYSLDKSHTSVLFKVQHLGLSTYVGRFNKFDASLNFDPLNIEAMQLEAIIEMGSLDINDPDLKDDLMGRSWFYQSKYPQAKFTTQSVSLLKDNTFEFTGELDWRGVKKPIVLTVIFHGGATNILTQKYTLGFSATGSFLRSDFGMGDFVPFVGDLVNIEVYSEFQKN